LNQTISTIIGLGLMLSLFACQGQQTQAEEATEAPQTETAQVATSEKMPPADFWKSYEAATDAQLIDVRTPEEVAEGKVAGATMMNFRDSNFQSQLETLDKEKPVYLYCRSGGRSGQAAATMERMGFQHIVDMQGGMMAWEDAGMPVEK